MKFHKDGTLPENGETFVFGSNNLGLHDGGAAKVAVERFGASRHEGVGMSVDNHTGASSYAIPTCDGKLGLALPLDTIAEEVHLFIQAAVNHPAKEFFVTRIGCGIAGFEDSDIAPMFTGAPDNCNFAEQWRMYLT